MPAAWVVDALQAVVEPFLATWIDHSDSVRVASLELIQTEAPGRMDKVTMTGGPS